MANAVNSAQYQARIKQAETLFEGQNFTRCQTINLSGGYEIVKDAYRLGATSFSGGGKKPWRQKGRGGARAGSTRTNVWVGGAVAFGPTNERNYEQKVNKKQKRLALEFAINEKANEGKIFIFDDLELKSGKTKDAANFIKKLGVRDALIVKNELDAQTLLAYRNLKNCYVIDVSEVNAYLIAVYGSVVFEKAAFESIVKED